MNRKMKEKKYKQWSTKDRKLKIEQRYKAKQQQINKQTNKKQKKKQ